MQLCKGDIVLKHGFDLLSLGIETVTHSLFSHVAIVADPEKELLIEAEGFREVGYRDLNDYKGECIILRVPNLTAEQQDKLIDYCKLQFGKQYNYKEIFEEFERYAFGIPPRQIDGRSFICSTLVQMAYMQIDIRLSAELLPSPDDIYRTSVAQIIGKF